MTDQNANLMSLIGPLLMMNRDNSSTSEKIIGMLLVFIGTKLMMILTNYFNRMITSISFSDCFKKKLCCFHCKAKYIYKGGVYSNSEYTTSYCAIQTFLYKKLKTDSVKTSYYVEDTHLMKIVNFVDTSIKYPIAPGILLEHACSNTTCDKEQIISTINYKITLTSLENDYDKLSTFVDHCIKLHNENKLGSQRIYIYTGAVNITSSYTSQQFESIDFDTTKTFDNMFFEQKKQIIERIDKFNTGESEYRRLGIPYTLGFMFHGAPGTGKTSVIKSIANYTKRQLVIIPVKKIKTIASLKSIFVNTTINMFTIPNNKRLYVFEEVDCSEWASIVRTRQQSDQRLQEKDNLDRMDKFMMNMLTKDEKSNDYNKTQDTLTLGDLLELLDGIIETPGRMIIMTSNHPEQIDPALMRPGRIDLSIEFKKLRRKDINDMYKLWFGEMLPTSIFERLNDYKFTQAEIGNIFASRDKKKIHRELVK